MSPLSIEPIHRSLKVIDTASTVVTTQARAPQAAGPSIIPQARFSSRLVADGSMLVTASYQIRHEQATTWTVDLPADTEILSATINKASVRHS